MKNNKIDNIVRDYYTIFLYNNRYKNKKQDSGFMTESWTQRGADDEM